MSKKPLDPNLASILDSIRATVGGEAGPPSAGTPGAMPTAEPTAEEEAVPDGDACARPERLPEQGAHAEERGGEMPRASATPGTTAKPAARKAVPPATRTVEEFLAELIRPQVEAWLSAHLPEIVQKQAAEEIARLTGKKSG